jgi:hypothetical protein
MKKILSFALATSLSLSAFSQSNVYLKINHLLGATPFALNTTTNNNTGNEFNVNRLEYYISSISIVHDGGTTTNISSHWILANASTQVYELLGNYNIVNIEKVTFSIGVETPTNHEDPSLLAATDPLAPKSPSMHWGWSAGYRFVAMEGLAGTSTPNQVYQLHGLGDVNFFSQTILTAGTSDANGLVIELNADYEKALKDINVASGVISHGEVNEAKKILENFKTNVFTSLEGNTPVSVNEIQVKEATKIYPNPANPLANISYEYQGKLKQVSIEISDISGRFISNQLLNNTNKLMLSGLDQGIYLINLKSNTGEIIATDKLIISK